MISSTAESSVSATNRAYSLILRVFESTFLGDTLKAKVFRGGMWLGSGSVVEQAARFGRNLALTRLLVPEAFGAMAIVLSVNSVLVSFTDMGVREALIRNPKGGQKDYVDAAWWLGLGRACLLATVLFTLAPLVAKFYGSPQLTALLRFSAVVLILGGASSPRADVAMKEMKFGRVAAIGNIGGICGVLITVILSFIVRDVWALVIGFCAESAARTILSYVLCPYVPTLRWNMEAVRDLLHFSRGLLGLSFLNLIFARADIFVLAKLYSPADLGLYTMAIYLVQTPTNLIMNLFGHTLLPAFSQIQGDTQRTNRILVKVSSLTVMLGLPALAFTVFFGHSLLSLTYGVRYGALAGAFALASCVALVNVLNGQITIVFYACGLPHLHRRAVAVMAATIVVLVYPCAKWLGPVGGQVACLLAVVVGYLLQLAGVRRLTGLDLALYAKAFPKAVLACLSVVAVTIFTMSFDSSARPLTNIAFGMAGWLLAYVLVWRIFVKGQTRRSQSVLLEKP